MSSRKNSGYLGAALLLAAIVAFPAATPAAQVKVGDAFPALGDFKLEGTLPEALKGKIVLVDFWASWCVPCKASFPALNELQARYSARGLVIVGINVDEKRADMESFLKKTPARFTIVRDASQKLVETVSVDTMPSSFLIDGEGKVRFLHTGYRGDETKKKYEEEIEALLKAQPARP